jgi:hypothetical protein
MAIELSNLTFTEQDDIVPVSGEEQIVNTGVANALAGNDTITGIGAPPYNPGSEYGLFNSGTLNTAEGNDIITGTAGWAGIINSGTLNTAEGNDIITANSGLGNGFNNTGTLNTGEGNDTITAGGRTPGMSTSGTFNTAEGDDVIRGSGLYNGISISGIFDTGDGNDSISGSSSIFDSGGPTYGISNYSFTFNTGDGNDTIEGQGLYGISNKGLINTGNGKDIIIAKGGTYTHGYSLENSFTIDTGDGDDIITSANVLYNEGVINTGNGDDSIIASYYGSPYWAAIMNVNAIETGEGNDIITSSAVIYNTEDGINNTRKAISNDGTINTGNGQDSIISLGNFTNKGGVFLGADNDSITVSILTSASVMIDEIDLLKRGLENFNAIETGDGDDRITSTGVIYNEGVINTGDGNDYIEGVDITGTGYGIYNNGGAIITGNGNDSIIANEGFESGPNSSGAWFLGEGDDYIKGFGSGDFYGGNGNDTLELTPGTYTVGIWGEAGESPIFTKGNQLMITSEFEKLKAGVTIYDFSSLTAGQIIIVT